MQPSEIIIGQLYINAGIEADPERQGTVYIGAQVTDWTRALVIVKSPKREFIGRVADGTERFNAKFRPLADSAIDIISTKRRLTL